MAFKPVSSQVDFVAQEHEILRFWEETKAFKKLQQMRAGGPRWSFIDGPITANNPMGVHHAWGRTYKDLYQRYKAMRGYDQRWQNGFDCQGLWVEVNVERDLNFKSKRDIEAYGIAPFVVLCKQRVLQFARIQTEQSIRLGYWMDWNDLGQLQFLHDKLGEDPHQIITIEGPRGPVTGTVEQIVGRLGMPELGGSYFTFSNENNYQIWMFLKRCWEKGWLYKGTDVMPWCPRCGTGISQHEIVTDGYQIVDHDAVYLRFPLHGRDQEALLVWTTTPWTLTSNTAAAVGPDLTYLRVRQGEWTYYLAEGTLRQALRGEYEVLGELKGSEMVGWTYEGPFNDLPAVQAALARHPGYVHRVIPWKEVGEEEGTGIVHIAPGCGAEDFWLSREFDLPVVAPLDEDGVYLGDFAWLTGRSASEVAQDIFEDLERKGLLYRTEKYTHRYPTCWRCGTDLVFRLVDEWFISMGEKYNKPREALTPEEKARSLRYQIMDVVDQIQWIPAFGYERELDWLHNMQDWMISKKRYWGLALPIYECQACGHFEVIGSEHELKARAVEGWEQFEGHTPHRPYVDAVKIACSHCGAKVSRIPDVGNPWLDAGIVPFSTLRYRDDRQYWEQWFPADWISESFPGQFRNWFYSLLAMSTVLENRPPFLSVFSYATLLAEDGRPMHKSWGNMIEFNEAAERIGVDVMRWMYISQKPDANLLFGYTRADETRRRFIIPLWNVYAFFVAYANVDGWMPRQRYWLPRTPDEPETPRTELDLWILGRLNQLIAEVTRCLDAYDAWHAAEAIEVFVNHLSNWYLRRSRRRFWKSEADADKEAAYATLYEVLVTLSKLLAPFLPFVTEAMYQNLVRSWNEQAPESVHHNYWPEADESRVDARLMADMSMVMKLASLGRAARSQANIKLRQPLAKAIVVLPDPAVRAGVERLAGLLLDELNVHELDFAGAEAELVEYTVRPVLPVLGPKYGPLTPKIRAALMAMDAAQVAHQVHAGQPVELTVDGQRGTLSPEEIEVLARARPGYAVAEGDGAVVGITTELTPDLVREGLAREVVRRVQNMRKDAGLELDHRIVTTWQAQDQLAEAITQFSDYIAQETLSVELSAGPAAEGAHVERFEVDGHALVLSIRPL